MSSASWDAGLAHRDIKPADLLVRNDQLLLIDVAFAEARPTRVRPSGWPERDFRAIKVA